MQHIWGNNNVHAILLMYDAVRRGPLGNARDQGTHNIRDLVLQLKAEPVITNFMARKMNLAYAKREWLWYLGADPKDDSICEHATMWKKLAQPDGTFFSNYGQYIFGDVNNDGQTQFEYVVAMLKKDEGTRRASMVLLKQGHLFEDNVDTVCTYAINFAIENGGLHMTVNMRSNDVIYGFTNDAFCFSMLYEFVYQLVRKKYPSLKRGEYLHCSNSMHVYERHYDMISQIVADGSRAYSKVNVPEPTAEEVVQIVRSKGKEGSGDYWNWLTSLD